MRRPSLGTHHLLASVLGTRQSGLIVLHDGRAAAVGKSQVHHNLYPTSTKLLEGELLRVVSHKVDMRGRTLRGLIERLDKRQPYYLSGEMMVGECKLERVEDLDLYRPVDCDGKAAPLPLCADGGTRPLPRSGGGAGVGVGAVLVERGGGAGGAIALGEEGEEDVIPTAQKQHL